MAIEWRLDPWLKRKGWVNANQLAVGAGLAYHVAFRLLKGEVKAADFGTLEKLCVALECEPGDLLVRVPEKGAKKR